MTDIVRKLENIADASMRIDGTDIPLGEQCREAAREIERLRTAAERAVKIIKTNLYHQREKVEDAASILRDALANQ
jgi:hypothetical protein